MSIMNSESMLKYELFHTYTSFMLSFALLLISCLCDNILKYLLFCIIVLVYSMDLLILLAIDDLNCWKLQHYQFKYM